MTSTWMERFAGHVRTIAPAAVGWLPQRRTTEGRDLAIPIVDDRFGPTTLSSTWCDRDGDDVVLLVHGLGGSRRASYVTRAARRLQAHGFATLALDLRGADRLGGGLYHVAQHEDLAAACAAPELHRFRRVFVLGFSMGGHVAVHFAASGLEPRLAGVAGLCTPLDLQATQQHLDTSRSFAYRHYVLRGLKQIYAALAARCDDLPAPNASVQRCRTFREWDRLTIAPRYGFDSPEHFYRARSAATVLPKLTTDTLLVLARNDPIVPPRLATEHLSRAPFGRLHVCVLPRGGHLQFAPDQRLGQHGGAGGSIVDQIAARWRRG